MPTDNPIVLPLDVDTLDEAKRLLDLLVSSIDVFKIGKQLFTAVGPESVRLVHSYGKRVFLDLKYHDIPNTVSQAAVAAKSHGVWMLNLHASGGRVMMEETRRAVGKASAETPLLIGVTVLTSIDDALWRDVHGEGARVVAEQVPHLARLAQTCGMDGVVASPQEIRTIREACGPNFLIVTPGVRPAWADANDQRRAMTPREAVAAGADYLVIGRPISAADDPGNAAERILDEIASSARRHE